MFDEDGVGSISATDLKKALEELHIYFKDEN